MMNESGGVKSVKRLYYKAFIVYAYAHLILIIVAVVFVVVNLLAIIVMDARYDPNALWVRLGNDIIRLHACLWRGMLVGSLLGFVLYGPSNFVRLIRDRIQHRKFRVRMPEGLFAAGLLVMFVITAIRFFQLPCPELLRHNYISLEMWLELADYPKPNPLSVICAIVLPFEDLYQIVSDHLESRFWIQ